jgi:hypothetical protein
MGQPEELARSVRKSLARSVRKLKEDQVNGLPLAKSDENLHPPVCLLATVSFRTESGAAEGLLAGP